MADSPLQSPVQYLPGVGPHRAELLARLDLRTVEDVLFNLPRDVLDLTHVARVQELEAGPVQIVRGRVVDLDGKRLATGKKMSAVLLDCGDGYVRGVWFNQNWVLQKFQQGQMVLFSGKAKKRSGRWEMSHPRIQWLDADDTEAHGGMLPRYGLTEGLQMHEMRRISRHVAAEYASLVPEVLPEEFRNRIPLLSIADALRAVHSPTSLEQYNAGRRRLIYEDLLEFELGLALRSRMWRQQSAAPKLPTTAKIDARIRRLMPFQFTAGQNQAVREIAGDLDSGWAMHRLLQADVGAGKTVVAIYAMLVTIAAGYQAVLMAPTELLANQHWQTIEKLLSHSRVERLLLTGELTAAERTRALERIRGGEVQLVVGTQAVIQKDVVFGKLGLVVIDEQHKFGVGQRARFNTSGMTTPHTLVMTATPIPRSLCLTQFGDLDLSIISDLPPGRQKVFTSRVTGVSAREKAWDFVRQKLRSGRQAFIVCPRIESTSGEDDASARAVYKQLSQGELRDFRVDLIHGQLDGDIKSAAMEAFRAGKTQALVSTTVVEVGVDVPNATIMIVVQAEKFGLAQLHQLRGRIGRGSFQGYCFLFSENDSPDALERLQALVQYPSGFDIAEADFRLRGPGDVLGTRQHGELPLRVADLVRDEDVLLPARDAAFELVRTGEFDEPHFLPLKIRVLERFGKLFELAGSG